jgi:membrane-associated HD superfamily phosphohydrolase
MKNVHDQMEAHASAAIIAGHVRDGIRLGQKYNLPRRVLDAIPQHHGTMLIKYFYHKALSRAPPQTRTISGIQARSRRRRRTPY